MSKVNGKKVSKKNQLHHVVDWDVDNLVFSDVEVKNIPDKPGFTYAKVGLLTKNSDENGNTIGSVGDLILHFDKVFSFGVSENTSPETKTVTGHSMSFALWSRDGATEREIVTSRKIEELIQKCKEHLLTIKKDLKKPKLEMSDLKGMDKLLYWKLDENGDRVLGQGPTFSPKLIEYKASIDHKTGKEKPYQMCTVFYLEDEVDDEGNPVEINPLEFLSTNMNKKYCYVTPAIKFESIFFGATAICIQCKITEADIQQVQSGPQKLLHSARNRINVVEKLNMNVSGVNSMTENSKEEEDKEDTKEEVKETKKKIKKKKETLEE